MMHGADSPDPFRALAVSLRESGHTAQSERILGILGSCWTTSSELYGELGLAVLAAQKECRPLSPEQKALARQCIRQVRKVWPTFGWFSWLPFR